MDSEQITVNASDREYRKKRIEELGCALAQIRARTKANRRSSTKKDDEVQQSGGSKSSEDTERTAMMKKILEEDRARFTKLQENRAKMKETMDQIMIEREEQKKVDKQLQEAIAKVTAPTPELPPLIKQRIIDLETTVESLKERISEKDKVLSSKTQALTVLHNQLMQRSQEQVEKTMAFTQEISTIKDDFGKREEMLKREIVRLKEREDELENRLSDKEIHSNEIESLQLELAEVRKELNTSISQSEESSKSAESLSKLNLKLKAQLKVLKLERDKFKKAQESIEDIEGLKNRIALLEEEKGNLQLQLVDFDDFKESFQQSEDKVKCLQSDLDQLRLDFKNLDSQKILLQESLESTNNQISEQADALNSLRISLKEMEEQKISAEMRSIEVEEKMEELQCGTSATIEQLLSEIASVKNQINERNTVIDQLNNQLSLKEQEISDIKGNNFPAEVETDNRLKEIESYNSELVEKVRELQLKADGHEHAVIELNDNISEKNEIINSLKTKYENLQSVVADLNNNKNILENEIQKLKVNEMNLKKESQTRDSKNTSNEQKEDSTLTQKFKKLAANYKIKTKLLQENELKVKTFSEAIEEKNKIVQELSLQADEFKVKEELLTKELENVKIKNDQLLRNLEELAPKIEEMESEKLTALEKADHMNRAFQELKEWKEGDAKLLKEHVTSVNSMVSNVSLLEQELKNLQSIVNEKNSVIGDLEIDRKKLVEDMKNSEFELERLRDLYQQESVKNQNFLINLQGLESEMLVSREEMNQIAEQLDAVTRNYNMCLGNLHDRENYIEALEQDIVGMKTKVYNLEAGIEDKHRMLDRCTARLEEAELRTQAFDKFQTDMNNKIKIMSDNENSMKSNLGLFQKELENLNKLNSELKQKNESSEKKVIEMSEEIKTLKDIKNSYNSTLDHIEVLNGELKQVMCDFETKNQELSRLGEERAELYNKLTDLEDTYSDLKVQLEESEATTSELQSDLQERAIALAVAQDEIKKLQAIIDDLNAKNNTSFEGINVSNSNEEKVQIISWDTLNQSEETNQGLAFDGVNLNAELDKKTKLLEEAEKEIQILKFEISSTQSEKDTEISYLRQEIDRIVKEYNELQMLVKTQNLVLPAEVNTKMFSWADHSQTNVNSEVGNFMDFEGSKKSLQYAVTQLKRDMNSISSENMAELTSMIEEIQKIWRGISELHTQSFTAQNNDTVLFSWGSHSQTTAGNEQTTPNLEFNEISPLQAAQQEITNLQASLSLLQSEKETEISALREEITRLLKQIEEMERLSNSERNSSSETKQEEVMSFSTQTNKELERDEEDGWGWIGAEANLDHKHFEALQIQKLTERVKELEEDQTNLKEKLNASKIKCVKLLKKVKEMEAVQVQTRSDRNVGFTDLDFALQEEFRTQIDLLENKNKELTSEISHLKLEKDNLNKKVDVIVSANEQLIEMKERQDIEVQMWQKKSVELKNQVQGLQWKLEELKSERPSLSKGEDELSEKFNALVAENEELQGIICNLKDGRPIGSADVGAELIALKDELKRLKEVRIRDKETFDNELKKANEELDTMDQQYDVLCKENISLKEQISELNKLRDDISSLQNQIEIQINQNEDLKKQVMFAENSKEDATSLLAKIQTLGFENAELKENLTALQKVNSVSAEEKQVIGNLKHQLTVLTSELQKVVSHNQNLQDEIISFKEKANSDILCYKETLEKADNDIKNMGNNLMTTQVELNELDCITDELISKYNLSVISNYKTDKLRSISTFVDTIVNSKLHLEKHIATLQEKEPIQREPVDSSSIQLGSTPPVFKGFSSLHNDPFDNLQSQGNVEVEQLKLECQDLKSLVQRYEQELSKLKFESASYEHVITKLKHDVTATNEELSRLKLESRKQIDETALNLETAHFEIQKWKDEAKHVRQELTNAIEKHSQEIEELRRNEKGSREKLSEIEENFQNSLLNKDQESRSLKQILQEKEQLLANEINERNALEGQFKSLMQNLCAAESRIGELSVQNEQFQNEFYNKRDEKNVIEIQQKELGELTLKLEHIQSVLHNSDSLNEHLKSQITILSDKIKHLEIYNTDLVSKLEAQSYEVTSLQGKIVDIESRKADLENIIIEKQREMNQISSQTSNEPRTENGEIEQLKLLINEKDMEVARISKLLQDTQKRLVQVQDSKPIDKLISLQNRLDQALYTTHLRDVRCDELTQEIMQLLEERDALQLRLSESLRDNEILRESNTQSSSASPELKSKLVELHKGYKKDPVVQSEMEDRHNQQMHLYTEGEREDNSPVDYGIFNWFFSTPSSSSS